jgi:hypothetical protein
MRGAERELHGWKAGEKETKTYEKGTCGVKGVLQLPEGGQVDEGAGCSGLDPWFGEDVGDDHADKLYQPDDPDGPGEPNVGQKLPHNRRKHQPARDTPARGNPHGNAPPPGKVGRQHSQRRAKQAPAAQAHAQPLGEEELPVLRGPGHGEDAADEQGGAEGEDGAEEAGVDEAAGEGADEEEEEDAGGAEPGYGGGGEGEGCGVVGLEGAEGVDPAPAYVSAELSHGKGTCQWVS